MATNISRIRAQIAKLEQQAEVLKRDALKRVQQEIRAHGLTVEDLFGTGAAVGAAKTRLTASSAGDMAPASKFADSNGNSWSGRGPKPKWLRDALEGGASLESFLFNPSGSHVAVGSSKKRTSTPAKQAKVAAKYADSTGNSWSGRGSQPRWLKAALEAGASIESLEVGAETGSKKQVVPSKVVAKRAGRKSAGTASTKAAKSSGRRSSKAAGKTTKRGAGKPAA